MISIHTWDNRDNLPDVDLYLNIMVAQLCADIDRENHPERGLNTAKTTGKDSDPEEGKRSKE